MASTELQHSYPERRTQSRIRIQIPITVHLSHRDISLTATSHDLSWGGVLFTLPESLPQGTDAVRVELPWRRNESISADATVLRCSPMSTGGAVVAARFVSLSFANQSRLERLLATLRATAAPRDCSGPEALVRELEVDVHEQGELQRMLGQIASGRHQLTVFEDYAIGQSICLSVGGAGDQPVLRLRARVVGSQKATMQGFGWAQPYDLTLEFEHPGEAIEQIVTRLQGPSADVSEVIPAAAAAPEISVRPEELCALEARFPELLSMVVASWRNGAAFEQLATDLLPADGVHPGGWPDEVWDELRFLRTVHSEHAQQLH